MKELCLHKMIVIFVLFFVFVRKICVFGKGRGL